MKYKVFWCKVNKYYTDAWLNSRYIQNKSGVFIASCVVTDNAKKKWIKFLKAEIPNLKENEKIYISWCWAFKDWEWQENFYLVYPELKEFENKIEILPENPSENHSQGYGKIKFKLPKINLTTKKFLLIQWWCDSFCTFCLTVIKRWRHFYRSKEDIVQEIIDFEMVWWKEIVLTWVNLWAWWKENTNDYKDSKLYEILEYILEKTEIPRIRISSLGPEFVDDKVLKIFQNKRILPHFHFSIQSGSCNILKLMKRHYDWEYIRNLLKKVREIKRQDWVEVSIWADLIVWFPGETEDDFLKTFDLVKDFKITKVHGFPFSAHNFWETVPASFFPNQIDEKVKKQRITKLLKLAENIRNEFISSQKWKTLEVLIESIKWTSWKWWSENYIECNEKNFEVLKWKIEKNEIIVWKLK